ncbi:hypothetical protein JCM21531_3221 [Acetivibrio straminisolvens JCM 21531]|uniref:Uncharacterized protein n=1 Tax=Acetivibrio straminisolvens JCM 21531 TaxID=1294263 RepID=W4VA30_9FIRM|nr:hypothetical protein JCM21531_3221 [Acetivibrio straminisolvens JCM 21531]
MSRRGSGLNTGPVGKPGGYSDRSKGAGANRGGGSGRSYGSVGVMVAMADIRPADAAGLPVVQST